MQSDLGSTFTSGDQRGCCDVGSGQYRHHGSDLSRQFPDRQHARRPRGQQRCRGPGQRQLRGEQPPVGQRGLHRCWSRDLGQWENGHGRCRQPSQLAGRHELQRSSQRQRSRPSQQRQLCGPITGMGQYLADHRPCRRGHLGEWNDGHHRTHHGSKLADRHHPERIRRQRWSGRPDERQLRDRHSFMGQSIAGDRRRGCSDLGQRQNRHCGHNLRCQFPDRQHGERQSGPIGDGADQWQLCCRQRLLEPSLACCRKCGGCDLGQWNDRHQRCGVRRQFADWQHCRRFCGRLPDTSDQWQLRGG